MKLSRLLENSAGAESSTTLNTAASAIEQMLISPGAVRVFYHIIGTYFRVLEEHGIARGEYSREIYTIQLRRKRDEQAVTSNFYIPYQPENTRIYTAVDTVTEMLEGAISQIPDEYIPYSWAHLHPGFSPLPSSTDARNNFAVLDRLGSNNKLTGYDRLTIKQPQVQWQDGQLALYDTKSKKRVNLKFATPPSNAPVAEWIDETPVTIYWSKSLIFNGRDMDGFFASFGVPGGGHDTRFAYSEISVATIAHDGTITRSTYEIPIKVTEIPDDTVLTDELKAQIENTLREKVIVPTRAGRRAVPEYMIDSLSREERSKLENTPVFNEGGTTTTAPEPEPEYEEYSFAQKIEAALAVIFDLPLPERNLKSRKLTMEPAPLKLKVKVRANGKDIIVPMEQPTLKPSPVAQTTGQLPPQ